MLEAATRSAESLQGELTTAQTQTRDRLRILTEPPPDRFDRRLRTNYDI
jgi:hypothetical protein